MVDINTHRVIDLIPSRDFNDVSNWLKTYPNLQVVSRDGSITYKNAINTSHPNAIQVSDRFHILKNLTSYCKDYLVQYFKPKVHIELDNIVVQSMDETLTSSNKNKKMTLEMKISKVIKLLENGTSKTKACKQLNMDIRVLNKLLEMTELERLTYLKSSQQKFHEEKVENKIKLINLVREMYINKYSMRAIAKELGISRKTVSDYLNKTITVV